MNSRNILFTGDFWHADFQRIISSIDIPLTMVPIDKLPSVVHQSFDLIVIAQSRRDQIHVEDVEAIQTAFANTPVVGLLGSWCEGETRSGNAWPGGKRVYWHQWKGQYESFLQQLDEQGITSWHLGRTASVADDIQSRVALENDEDLVIGVSAWTNTQYEMVADAVRNLGWRPFWIERTAWDGESKSLLSAICIDADSWGHDLQQRIKWLGCELPDIPSVLLLSFPRPNEVDEIREFGISEVVSKPFTLDDLRLAILNCRRNFASKVV